MIPPLLRVVNHLGFAIAFTDAIAEGEWENSRSTIIDELQEASNHLTFDLEIDPTPFIPATAIAMCTTLGDQFPTLMEAIPNLTQEEAFTELKTLTENCVYVAAVLERFITGDDADEGRNP